jgi:hypothetical protein
MIGNLYSFMAPLHHKFFIKTSTVAGLNPKRRSGGVEDENRAEEGKEERFCALPICKLKVVFVCSINSAQVS